MHRTSTASTTSKPEAYVHYAEYRLVTCSQLLQDCHNLVAIVAMEKEISIQAALEHVQDMIVEATQRFWNGVAKVPSFGPKMDPIVQKYVKGLEKYTRFVIQLYGSARRCLIAFSVEASSGIWNLKDTLDEITWRSNARSSTHSILQSLVSLLSISSTTTNGVPALLSAPTTTHLLAGHQPTLYLRC